MTGLLIVGIIVGLIGNIWLIVAGFRSGILWGIAILVGPSLVYLLISDIWIAELLGTALILAFVVPRWQETRIPFVLWVVGSLMILPSFILWGDWDEQASYAGDCLNPARGTVCAEFEDGFIWLIEDEISSWEERLEGARPVQVAMGGKGHYEHALLSSSVRFIPNDGYVPETEQSEGYGWLEPDEERVRLEVEPQFEEPPSAPPLEDRRASLSKPASPGTPAEKIEQVYVFNKNKTYYPLDCQQRPAKSFMMARSMAIRQGYKLARDCSE